MWCWFWPDLGIIARVYAYAQGDIGAYWEFQNSGIFFGHHIIIDLDYGKGLYWLENYVFELMPRIVMHLEWVKKKKIICKLTGNRKSYFLILDLESLD